MSEAATIPDSRRRVFRVHLWMRAALCLHAVVVDVARLPEAKHPGVVVLAVLVMAAWTLCTQCRYDRAERRWYVFAADMGMTLALLGLSPVALWHWQYGGIGASLIAYWLAGAPLAVAINYGTWPGAAAGLVVSLAAFALTPTWVPAMGGGVLLTVLSAAGLGWLVSQMDASMRERDAFFQQAAAMGERERLNRIVHDGVLQVLAMVERDGADLGSRGQMLARMAKEQEIKLRALLQSTDVDITRGDRVDETETNLMTLLDRHESRSVTVSAMADAIMLATDRAKEVEMVVAEVLRNVDRHAGPDAHAWVLVEHEGDQLLISVRDDGVGAKPREVLAAFERGRLGVRESIIGRVRDLGGETDLRAAVGRGVEWEFKIPVQAPVSHAPG